MNTWDFNPLKKQQWALDEAIFSAAALKRADTFMHRCLSLIVEVNELANCTRCFKYWSKKPADHKAILLEEYVDGLHFIISLSYDHDVSLVFDCYQQPPKFDQTSLIDQFWWLNAHAAHLNDPLKFLIWAQQYCYLGMMLNFTYREIIDAYQAKLQLNYHRQASGY